MNRQAFRAGNNAGSIIENMDYGPDFSLSQGRSQTHYESRSRKCSHNQNMNSSQMSSNQKDSQAAMTKEAIVASILSHSSKDNNHLRARKSGSISGKEINSLMSSQRAANINDAKVIQDQINAIIITEEEDEKMANDVQAARGALRASLGTGGDDHVNTASSSSKE